MGLIREPLNVDFYVINREPTEKESKMMSEYIRKYKEENSNKTLTPRRKASLKSKVKVA